MVFANFDSGHQALSNHLRAKNSCISTNELECARKKAMIKLLPTHHWGFREINVDRYAKVQLVLGCTFLILCARQNCQA